MNNEVSFKNNWLVNTKTISGTELLALMAVLSEIEKYIIPLNWITCSTTTHDEELSSIMFLKMTSFQKSCNVLLFEDQRHYYIKIGHKHVRTGVDWSSRKPTTSRWINHTLIKFQAKPSKKEKKRKTQNTKHLLCCY